MIYRFEGKQKDIILPDCNRCKYYNGYGICEAFPSGIPYKLLQGKVKHIKPYSEQKNNNIVFEVKT